MLSKYSTYKSNKSQSDGENSNVVPRFSQPENNVENSWERGCEKSRNRLEQIGHFPAASCLCVKTRSPCETIHMKCVLTTGSFSCKLSTFSYERFYAKTRFKLSYWLNRKLKVRRLISSLFPISAPQRSTQSERLSNRRQGESYFELSLQISFYENI